MKKEKIKLSYFDLIRSKKIKNFIKMRNEKIQLSYFDLIRNKKSKIYKNEKCKNTTKFL